MTVGCVKLISDTDTGLYLLVDISRIYCFIIYLMVRTSRRFDCDSKSIRIDRYTICKSFIVLDCYCNERFVSEAIRIKLYMRSLCFTTNANELYLTLSIKATCLNLILVKISLIWSCQYTFRFLTSFIIITSFQLGVAIGFFLPSTIVDGGTTEEVEQQLYTMFIAVGCITTIIFALVLFCR